MSFRSGVEWRRRTIARKRQRQSSGALESLAIAASAATLLSCRFERIAARAARPPPVLIALQTQHALQQKSHIHMYSVYRSTYRVCHSISETPRLVIRVTQHIRSIFETTAASRQANRKLTLYSTCTVRKQ